MKITRNHLRKIIKEEISKIVEQEADGETLQFGTNRDADCRMKSAILKKKL